MSNQNSPSTAATYQSIIIALVAAGILSTGLVSIIYRRRQRQRLLRASQGGMRTIILPDGRVFSVPREGMNGGGVGRGRGKKVGKEPGIWDTVLGDVEEPEGNEKRRKGGEEREKGEWVGEAEVKGDWQPVSLAFPPSLVTPQRIDVSGKPPDPIDEAVEMTVLIAMPTPHPHFPSTSSPSSSSSTLHISHTDFPTLYQPDPVLDDIPPVEIATTEVPITCTTDSDRWSLDKLRTEAIGRNGVDVPLVQGRGVRIERTDGFRGTS